MADLLEPKEVSITDANGVERIFILSKIPAIQAHEIVYKYALGTIPKIGDYEIRREMALKALNYVSAKLETGEIRLSTELLVNCHCYDWETYEKLVDMEIGYNCSAFLKERILGFSVDFVQNVKEKVLGALTGFLEQSSPQVKQP